MLRRIYLLAATIMLLVVAPAVASAADTSTVLVRQDAQLGALLTDPNGMTLYQFTKDPANDSVCYDACATAWPPLVASGTLSLPTGVPGLLGTITRKDGSSQVTYNGVALYHFAPDKAPGDTKGQNVGKVWFVVAPKLAATKLPATGGVPLGAVALTLLAAAAMTAAGLRIRNR